MPCRMSSFFILMIGDGTLMRTFYDEVATLR